jgi:hypothetical protein
MPRSEDPRWDVVEVLPDEHLHRGGMVIAATDRTVERARSYVVDRVKVHTS